MKTSLLRSSTSRTLLNRLIDSPDLVQNVRALPPPAFSTLIRHIGVEDAGEIIALATTEQLVTAFDEDLFANTKPGARETFDARRFIVWLEVLLEAGDEVAAARIVELSEDFVIHAISSIILVLDHDALLARMGDGGDDAEAADKAIDSCLSEEIDGYLLLSREHDGWDAVLALILALDRDHRQFLVRVLDRCADMASVYLDDLDELAQVLSAADSNAEDVEAEREERRSKSGYVDPRAARNFLTLARTPLTGETATIKRDPVTRAYFRELEPVVIGKIQNAQEMAKTSRLLAAMDGIMPEAPRLLTGDTSAENDKPLVAALRTLGDSEPEAFGDRMEEFAYLTNVVVAGASNAGERFDLADAAEAVLATVAFGAEIEALERRGTKRVATTDELHAVLRDCPADVLFRKAVSMLVTGNEKTGSHGLLHSPAEFKSAQRSLCGPTKKRRTNKQ